MSVKSIDYSDCVDHMRESIAALVRLSHDHPEKRDQLRQVIAGLRRQAQGLAGRPVRVRRAVSRGSRRG